MRTARTTQLDLGLVDAAAVAALPECVLEEVRRLLVQALLRAATSPAEEESADEREDPPLSP